MSQYKKYPADKALKKGCPSTIESAVVKLRIAQEYVNLRDEMNKIKPIYDKAEVINKQLIQSRQDNETKLKQLTAKNKRIKEMNEFIQKQDTQICQLENQLKSQKETSVDRADNQRLEGFLKKKDQQIKELEEKINATKTNNIEALKNTIRRQNEKIKHLSEGYTKFNLDDLNEVDTLKGQMIRLTEENKTLSDSLLTEKSVNLKINEKITALYDSL